MAQLKAGYEREIEMIKMQMANATDKQKLEAELINKAAERASKEAIEVAKLEVEAYLQNKEIDLGAPGIGAGLQERERTYDPASGTFI